MGRKPCCAKEGLNRGPWSAKEDRILANYIKTFGEGKWRDLPQRAGLKRCGKSCRLRWLNYLRPDIKRGNISAEEEELVIRLHKLIGNRWSLIAGRLPGRTDNEIKNYWNTHLSKRLQQGGCRIDKTPVLPNLQSKMKCKRATSIPAVSAAIAPPPNAIRTKAVRCSRAVILRPPEDKDQNVENNYSSAPKPDGITYENNINNSYCSSRQEDNYSTEFLMHFDIDELLSDALIWDPNQAEKVDGGYGDHQSDTVVMMSGRECGSGNDLMVGKAKSGGYWSNNKDDGSPDHNWLTDDMFPFTGHSFDSYLACLL